MSQTEQSSQSLQSQYLVFLGQSNFRSLSDEVNFASRWYASLGYHTYVPEIVKCARRAIIHALKRREMPQWLHSFTKLKAIFQDLSRLGWHSYNLSETNKLPLPPRPYNDYRTESYPQLAVHGMQSQYNYTCMPSRPLHNPVMPIAETRNDPYNHYPMDNYNAPGMYRQSPIHPPLPHAFPKKEEYFHQKDYYSGVAGPSGYGAANTPSSIPQTFLPRTQQIDNIKNESYTTQSIYTAATGVQNQPISHNIPSLIPSLKPVHVQPQENNKPCLMEIDKRDQTNDDIDLQLQYLQYLVSHNLRTFTDEQNIANKWYKYLGYVNKPVPEYVKQARRSIVRDIEREIVPQWLRKDQKMSQQFLELGHLHKLDLQKKTGEEAKLKTQETLQANSDQIARMVREHKEEIEKLRKEKELAVTQVMKDLDAELIRIKKELEEEVQSKNEYSTKLMEVVEEKNHLIDRLEAKNRELITLEKEYSERIDYLKRDLNRTNLVEDKKKKECELQKLLEVKQKELKEALSLNEQLKQESRDSSRDFPLRLEMKKIKRELSENEANIEAKDSTIRALHEKVRNFEEENTRLKQVEKELTNENEDLKKKSTEMDKVIAILHDSIGCLENEVIRLENAINKQQEEALKKQTAEEPAEHLTDTSAIVIDDSVECLEDQLEPDLQ